MTEDSSEEDRSLALNTSQTLVASLRTKGVKRKTVRFENIAYFVLVSVCF